MMQINQTLSITMHVNVLIKRSKLENRQYLGRGILTVTLFLNEEELSWMNISYIFYCLLKRGLWLIKLNKIYSRFFRSSALLHEDYQDVEYSCQIEGSSVSPTLDVVFHASSASATVSCGSVLLLCKIAFIAKTAVHPSPYTTQSTHLTSCILFALNLSWNDLEEILAVMY